MPPAKPSSGSPQDWLTRAKGKLAPARVPLPPGGFLEDLCFHAQQAAELAIKAVYQQHGWRFAFVHDLGQLLNGLKNNGLTLPADVQRADRLSDYAVQLRYPGPFPPVTQTEYQESVQIAQAVLTWADTMVP